MGRARIRPAMLAGRRVDLWEARIWSGLCPGWRPRGGYWRTPEDGWLRAALDAPQSLAASALLGGLPIELRPSEAEAAERGEPQVWTFRLTPVPPDAAEAELRRGKHPCG